MSKKGSIPITDKKPRLFNKKKSKGNIKFKYIDLFAGIGGTRLGFDSVGGKCVFTSEWDKYCQLTYQTNFGELPHGDITKIDANLIPDFDVLLAGFPCQPFSTIGLRQGFGHDTQGTLFYDIERILKTKKPTAFLLENVPGLKNHDDGKTFKIVLRALRRLDYDVQYKILNAVDFGVPQKRKRIYLVGFKKNKVNSMKFQFPRGKKKKKYINEFLEKDAKGYSISKHLQENYLFKKDDGRPIVLNHNSKVAVKTLVSTYHKIQRLTGTFVKDGETGLRLLTENECKAIMGFNKNFKVPVSRTQMYRQFGNSVVVPVIKEIAKEMALTLEAG